MTDDCLYLLQFWVCSSYSGEENVNKNSIMGRASKSYLYRWIKQNFSCIQYLYSKWMQDKIVFIITFNYCDIFMLLTKALAKFFSWPRSSTTTTGSRFFISNMDCISPIVIFASFFPNISTPALDKPCPTINTWLARPTISVALVNMSVIALAERWNYTGRVNPCNISVSKDGPVSSSIFYLWQNINLIMIIRNNEWKNYITYVLLN